MRFDTRVVILLLASMTVSGIDAAGAQEREPWSISHSVFVGGELEGYLRNLQLLGESPLYPWSIRSFSAGEVEALAPNSSDHPWSHRFDFSAAEGTPLEFRIIAPQAELFYNSAFPYGHNDGAIWAGRGLTSSVRAGFFASAGPLSLTVAPVAFRSENRSFGLEPNGQSGKLRFQDPRSRKIDLPQRFGDDAYMRVDPGQSSLRLDLMGAVLGASTANQHWGPAVDYPLILGNNAGGFPHVFLGTSRPVDLWVGTVHTRIVWGRLDQSEFSPIQSGEDRRFASALVAVFSPAFLDGLEIGGARFFHTNWPSGGIDGDDLLTPLQGILKTNVGGGDADAAGENQIASVFGRWALPSSGVEVYGEYVREDHSYDLRDLTLEPDHISGYTLGLRKVWEVDDAEMVAMRAELSNTEISHLVQVRGQSALYEHSPVRQGHTQRGQVLGSYTGFGGGGSTLAVDWYTPEGRWSAFWSRALVDELAGERDVRHALNLERLMFRGGVEIEAGVTTVYEINRTPGKDAWNVNANLIGRYRF
ncbi:MAG TPA: capsule assembly Wzi family protein [Longimicrobiaceae bacterium]|nr:capsule assembly Wzi family protein [Longimicrobiaceae bacterium]